MNKYEPTEVETAALALYAERKGEGWKDALMTDWATGRDVNALPDDKGCALRRVRNRGGPSWLAKY